MATIDIYTLSLHDALPILVRLAKEYPDVITAVVVGNEVLLRGEMTTSDLAAQQHLVADQDRKSTRLNSSHLGISYAVFCLKKKKKEVYSARARRARRYPRR